MEFHFLLIRSLYYRHFVDERLLSVLDHKSMRFFLKRLNFLTKHKIFIKKDKKYILPLGHNIFIPLVSLLFIPYRELNFQNIGVKMGAMEQNLYGDKSLQMLNEWFVRRLNLAQVIQDEVIDK